MGLVQNRLSFGWFFLLGMGFCTGYINLADIECGQQSVKANPKIRAARIAGGREAFHGEFPWIVSLQFNSGDTSHFCGGFLVNRSTVISAAHCFSLTGVSTKRVNVVIGEHVVDEAEQPIDTKIYEIASVNVHPEYTLSEATRHDIALVHLKKHVEWSSYVQPACLSNEEDDLEDGKMSQVAGWGQTGKFSAPAATLMTVEVTILSHAKCENEYDWIPSKSQFCAGHTSRDKGACKGDSGSPLMMKDSSQDALNVVGIHTGGHGCGLNMLPGVYTKISSYITWIQTNIA